MRINVRKLYESRLEEINIQIKQATYRQLWNKKKKLVQERKEIIEKLKETKEHKKGANANVL